MKLGFVCTNFNNSDYTTAFVDSLHKNGQDLRNVVIVDNNSNQDEISKLRNLNLIFRDLVVIYNKDNIGYFPGLNIGISYLRDNFGDFDCIVVGNNDLVFPDGFLNQVKSFLDKKNDDLVISPNLITLDGINQNPHVIKKISPFREFVWDIYYSNFFISRVIHKFASFSKRYTERKDYLEHNKSQYIYQGYGACYLLTKNFFKHFDNLFAPVFLMGEELFLTKQLESVGCSIFYEPSIIVMHHDHATMAKLPSRKLWEISRDSHKVYRKYVGYFNSKKN